MPRVLLVDDSAPRRAAMADRLSDGWCIALVRSSLALTLAGLTLAWPGRGLFSVLASMVGFIVFDDVLERLTGRVMFDGARPAR